MNRALGFAIACVMAVGCGGNDEHAPTDGATIDSPSAIDAPSNSIDSPVTIDGPTCAKPVIFIDGDGGTYTMSGTNDSRNNQSSMITGTRMFMGPGATRAHLIADKVSAALAAQGVQVTFTDPGNALHVEVVLATSNWTFANPVAVAPLNCNVILNSIGFVNLTGAQTDDDAAGAALFVIGAAAGLDISTTATNCMNTAAAGCTFSATATTANNCGMATQDQPSILHTAFGCL